MSERKESYVCPQCGSDPNGSEVHALTHHTLPPYSERSAIEIASFQAENSRLVRIRDAVKDLEPILIKARKKFLEKVREITNINEEMARELKRGTADLIDVLLAALKAAEEEGDHE